LTVTELFGSLPPSGVEILVAWLSPLGDASAERKAGDGLPFWLVSRVAGPDDKITDHGTYSVHSMAESLTAAEDHALLAHQRILALGPPLAPQRRVTISGGRVVFADKVTTDLFPRYEYYSDNIRRYVARYDIDLRFIAV
jgi:hypothetical protein